jgi:sugar phosphate isomerase/epimerase
MAPISVQLYTLREEAQKDFFGVLRTLADIGFKGVETAGLHGKSAAETAKVISDLGLVVSSAHTALPTPESIDEMEDTAKTLGSTYVISGFGPNEFETADDVKRSADRLQAAAELAKSRGLIYGMHNHWWEFKTIDGRLAYDIVMEAAPSMFSELDVYWAAFGGSDPAAVVAKNKARLPFLHIKDGMLEKDGPMLAVGTGKLDMPAIIGAADPSVLKWLVVELDRCATDMTEAVRGSYKYLVGNGLAAGNK